MGVQGLKTIVFDVAGRIEKAEAPGEAFNFAGRKNEAKAGGVPGDFLVFVVFEEGGGVLEVAAFEFAALFLDFAKLGEGFVELAG